MYVTVQSNGLISPFLSPALLRPKTLTGLIFPFSHLASTSRAPFFNRPDAISRQLASALSHVDARELRRHLMASGPRLSPPAQQPAGALSRADGVMSALTAMRPRSPMRRTLPLASMPVHWLSRVSTCISFRIAHSARLTVRGGKSCPLVSNHTRMLLRH